MIDDIVELPRRLSQFKIDTTVTSHTLCTVPISSVPKYTGYDSPRDDVWVEFGYKLGIPTGTDAWFRYKLIENTRHGICEYFCISQMPLDLMHIVRSKLLQLYCLWATVTNPVDYSTKRYVFWETIRELTGSCSPRKTDAPLEAIIADEIRAFGALHDRPDVAEPIKNYPAITSTSRIGEIGTETDDVDTYLNLLSNMMSVHDSIVNEDWSVDAMDIYRGIRLPEVLTNIGIIRGNSVLPFLSNGSVLIKDILHLLSPMYGVHAYLRSFTNSLPDGTDITAFANEDEDLFSIIKYIEKIPYSEFETKINCASQENSIRIMNPYDLNYASRNGHADHMSVTRVPQLEKLRAVFVKKFPGACEVYIARSWAEEAYITICYENNKAAYRFYLDLSAVALISRSFIRDYSNQLTYL